MDLSRLRPTSGLTDPEEKVKCKRDAKEMQQSVLRYAEKAGSNPPPYEFLELIGKGTFGRVYKCIDRRNNDLVAIKMINIDAQDYDMPIAAMEDNIKALNKEISMMKQLKDNKVRNVLLIHEAFDMGPYVWIVSDYCTGGSVKTLQGALTVIPNSKKGFEERYIIPIARELAVAVKGLHDLGVIHRDIKGANVYVNESGDIRLGDFGIVGVVDDSTSKRQTIVGTPHWLPKEIVEAIATDQETVSEAYGTEVDIWSYGCTLYELATGSAPNHSTGNYKVLAASLENRPPRLVGSEYSDGLRDLVAFCLDSDPKHRPTIDAVLEHPYIAETREQYPTSNLIGLIDKFKIWMHGGGSRTSLWMQSGADVGINDDDDEEEERDEETDGWNFSTSDNFDQEFGRRYSLMFAANQDDYGFDAPAGAGLPPLQTQNLPMAERVRREHADLSANRGEQSLGRLFDTNTPAYQMTPEQRSFSSDLPLRTFTADAPSRESVLEIDLDVAETPVSGLTELSFNESTIRPVPRSRTLYDDDDEKEEAEEEDDFTAGLRDSDDRRDTREWKFPSVSDASNRKTMEWTFGNAGQPRLDESTTSNEFEFDSDASASRPGLSRIATEPVGNHFRDFSFCAQPAPSSAPSNDRRDVTSMIDLDLEHTEPLEIPRPPTASSATGSAASYMSSGNPFDLEEDPAQNELDRQRFSYHKQLQSEDAGRRRRRSHKTVSMHARAYSLSSTDSERERSKHNPSNFGDAYIDQPGSVGYHIQPPGSSLEANSGGPRDLSISQWPSFDNFDHIPRGLPAVNDIPRLNDPKIPTNKDLNPAVNGRSREPSNEPPTGPEIEFPIIEAPHSDSLIENADPTLLEDEFTRTLDQFSAGMEGLAQALRRQFHVEEDDDSELTSDFDSGFDSV